MSTTTVISESFAGMVEDVEVRHRGQPLRQDFHTPDEMTFTAHELADEAGITLCKRYRAWEGDNRALGRDTVLTFRDPRTDALHYFARPLRAYDV